VSVDELRRYVRYLLNCIGTCHYSVSEALRDSRERLRLRSEERLVATKAVLDSASKAAVDAMNGVPWDDRRVHRPSEPAVPGVACVDVCWSLPVNTVREET
jgi:hypothetical protein